MTERPYADLKAENLRLSRLDQVERPETCRALPVKLTLNNTHKCNIRCPLCFKQFEPGSNMSYPDMPIEVFRTVAEELFPAVDEVALSVSGEPLIAGPIEEELELGATFGVHFAITTNGVPLASARLRALALRHIRTIHISMDAAHKDTFERIREGARWEVVLEALGALLRERAGSGRCPRVLANFVMMRENIEELPAWVALMARLGVDGCHAEHVVVPDFLRAQSLVAHKRLAAQMMAAAAEVAARTGMALHLPPPFPMSPEEAAAPPSRREDARPSGGGRASSPAEGPTAQALPPPDPAAVHASRARIEPGPAVLCPYVWRETWVHHDGSVLCCDTPTFPHPMGRIPDERPSAVWNGPAYRELRRRLVAGEVFSSCRHCHVMGQIDTPGDPLSFVKGT